MQWIAQELFIHCKAIDLKAAFSPLFFAAMVNNTMTFYHLKNILKVISNLALFLNTSLKDYDCF